MEHESPLAQFLRARRRQVGPESVNLPPGPSARRVAGLRREEVALLAGISNDYYLRLEQGRELHPSTAVLAGLVRALRLDSDGAAHLHRLARPSIPAAALETETVNPNLIGLIRSMPSVPAHVVNRYLDILYVNRLAEALSPGFRVGNNLVKLMFNPRVPRDAYWRMTARRAVAYLRASVNPHDDGPEISELLEELQSMDPEFEVMWDLHETRLPAAHPSVFEHADFGLVEVRYQTFELPGTGGQSLGMYVPAAGGPSAEKLQLLSLRFDENAEGQGDPATPRKTGNTTLD